MSMNMQSWELNGFRVNQASVPSIGQEDSTCGHSDLLVRKVGPLNSKMLPFNRTEVEGAQ